MIIDALKGDSLSHSALRARSYARVYFAAMKRGGTAGSASTPAIAPAPFNYFGVQVSIEQGQTPDEIAQAVQAELDRRLVWYREHVAPNAPMKTLIATPGLPLVEQAWTATQRAQEDVNTLFAAGQTQGLSRYEFEFEGRLTTFNPYTSGQELAEKAMAPRPHLA